MKVDSEVGSLRGLAVAALQRMDHPSAKGIDDPALVAAKALKIAEQA